MVCASIFYVLLHFEVKVDRDSSVDEVVSQQMFSKFFNFYMLIVTPPLLRRLFSHFKKTNDCSTGWFKALVQYLRRLLLKLSGAENKIIIFSRFATVSELRSFNSDVTFVIVSAEFNKQGTVCFNIKCQLMSHFLMKRREKSDSALCRIFRPHFKCFFWSTFMLVWWELVRLFTGTDVRVW
jgi:hypothetical protein